MILWLLECTAMKANGLCGNGSIGIGLYDGIDDNSYIGITGDNVVCVSTQCLACGRKIDT